MQTAISFARSALFSESVGDNFARDVYISLLSDEVGHSADTGRMLRLPSGESLPWAKRMDAVCVWAAM